jgi:putative copper export protein
VQSEPLITWSEPVTELIGFIGLFLGAGAVGFRFAAVRGHLSPAAAGARGDGLPDAEVWRDAARRAAVLGLIGWLIRAALTAVNLPGAAARQHTTVGALVGGNLQTQVQLTFLLVALIGFALAIGGRNLGWILAAIGVVAGQLRGVFWGQWGRMGNPVHALAAGLWIGTLFVLVVAGIGSVLRHERGRQRRGVLVADMVNGFSPLALTCGVTVVGFGVWIALRHLPKISDLWTTPYGYALIVKLVLVAFVFALGAWNWRRQRPTLGTETAADSIRRSSIAELSVAGVVLVVTAILVSLPAPPRPGARGGEGGPPPGGAPPAVQQGK